MLIRSARQRPDDLRHWRRVHERVDGLNAGRFPLDRLEREALVALCSFAASGGCYAGTSWGKDSTVIAYLVAVSGLRIPVVWVRVEGWDNPDSPLVRDAFLGRWDIDYHEITVREDEEGARDRTRMRDGDASAEVTEGFPEAARRWGDRHISGVRADESTVRRIRMARWGPTTSCTCAPIGWWTTEQVFAFAHSRELPVHPAYACSFGGRLDRSRLRVAALGGHRGQGMGRGEVERAYYPEVVRRHRARS